MVRLGWVFGHAPLFAVKYIQLTTRGSVFQDTLAFLEKERT
jgi:hypothetical protein